MIGNGKKLQRILESKKISVQQLSRQTGIKPTTLYSIIQRDGIIRLDFAVRIADTLDIDIHEICNDNVILPERPITPQLSNAATDIIENLNEKDLRILNNFLTDFYVLDDDGREQIIALIKCMEKQQKRKQ